MLRLYKCEYWDEDKCKDYDACHCRCTFDPRHVWRNNSVIQGMVEGKITIDVDCSGCPANTHSAKMEFYKEVKNNGSKNKLTTIRPDREEEEILWTEEVFDDF